MEFLYHYMKGYHHLVQLAYAPLHQIDTMVIRFYRSKPFQSKVSGQRFYSTRIPPLKRSSSFSH